MTNRHPHLHVAASNGWRRTRPSLPPPLHVVETRREQPECVIVHTNPDSEKARALNVPHCALWVIMNPFLRDVGRVAGDMPAPLQRATRWHHHETGSIVVLFDPVQQIHPLKTHLYKINYQSMMVHLPPERFSKFGIEKLGSDGWKQVAVELAYLQEQPKPKKL